MKQYKICGHTVGIEHISDGVDKRCASYKTDNADAMPEQIFSIDKDEFDRESKLWVETFREEIESYLLQKKLFRWLLDHDAMYIHAAAVEMDGQAFLFCAPSGTGKSTHAALWRQHFGKDRVTILNDDKPILRRMDDGKLYVSNSPWSGKENENVNADYPLRAICVLHKSKENSIERMSDEDAAVALLIQTRLPDSRDYASLAIDFVNEIIEKTPIYSLNCNISEEAAELSHRTMTNS